MDERTVTAEELSTWLGREVATATATRIGDGLVGANLRVELTYPAGVHGPHSVVVKLPSDDPTSRQTGITLRNYEREVRFYREIAPTVRIRVPGCWHADWDADTGDFVLVLEDLAPATQGDQIQGCTLPEARAAVAELARLHASRWDDPELHDVDWLNRREGDESVAILTGLYSNLLPGFLGTYATYLDQGGIDVVQRFAAMIPAWLDGREGPLAVVHGDFRLDNLLFGGVADAPTVATVDWQTPGHGPGVADLSYFLGAGLVPEARRQHERDLVEAYAIELADQDVTELDQIWLWDHYRREAVSGIVMTVVASQIVARTDRSEAMFAAMATRHVQHAIDLDTLAAI